MGDATYTLDDVAAHKSKDDCWIAVDGGACAVHRRTRDWLGENGTDSRDPCVPAGVYDVTDFLPIHPGGNILFSVAGTDATDFFVELHKEGILEEVRAVPAGATCRCQLAARDS